MLLPTRFVSFQKLLGLRSPGIPLKAGYKRVFALIDKR